MTKLKVPVTDNDHIQGSKKALITMVQYGDYECPACGQAFPIIKLIQKHFGAKLRFVFRNFPLTEAHPYAEVAAETAEFAAIHNKFWEMHDLIYMNQEQLRLPTLFQLCNELQLSEDKLKDALENGLFRAKIKTDFLGGVYSGVNGTPAFFINGEKYDGSYDYENLLESIERHLAEV